MNRRSGGHGGVRELEALEGTCAANLIILSIISLLEAFYAPAPPSPNNLLASLTRW